MNYDKIWFVLLPIAILIGFTLPKPLAIIQITACSSLLLLKIYLHLKYK